MVVKVNDRGPFVDPGQRVIDLSFAAAVRLDMIANGTARVRIEAVQPKAAGAGTSVASRPGTTAPEQAVDPEYASFLQMGAFSDHGNAAQLQQRINGIGVQAYVEQVGGLFKVKAGPYADADQALQRKLEIDRLLDIEAMVVFE